MRLLQFLHSLKNVELCFRGSSQQITALFHLWTTKSICQDKEIVVKCSEWLYRLILPICFSTDNVWFQPYITDLLHRHSSFIILKSLLSRQNTVPQRFVGREVKRKRKNLRGSEDLIPVLTTDLIWSAVDASSSSDSSGSTVDSDSTAEELLYESFAWWLLGKQSRPLLLCPPRDRIPLVWSARTEIAFFTCWFDNSKGKTPVLSQPLAKKSKASIWCG